MAHTKHMCHFVFMEQYLWHNKQPEEWLQASVSMSTNVFFASSVLLMCSGLVRTRDNNFIIRLMSKKRATTTSNIGK